MCTHTDDTRFPYGGVLKKSVHNRKTHSSIPLSLSLSTLPETVISRDLLGASLTIPPRYKYRARTKIIARIIVISAVTAHTQVYTTGFLSKLTDFSQSGSHSIVSPLFYPRKISRTRLDCTPLSRSLPLPFSGSRRFFTLYRSRANLGISKTK